MAIDRVGVVGFGVMGRGIAQVAALAGCDVVACDLSDELNEAGLESVRGQLAREVKKGRLREVEAAEAVARIRTALSHSALKGCPVVIEAITEDEERKAALFRELDAELPDETVLVTNTSSLSVTALAGMTRRPERVVGMHFFNPVPAMKLVEVVRALQTDDATFAFACQLAARLGKEVVTARDTVAFIVNRTLLPFLNEAIFALAEGVASAEEIDKAVKLGLNHPMGPLELCDLIGLGTLLSVMDAMHRRLGDPKYRPSPLLRQYVEAGWLGRKTGRGFHVYRAT
jgi:3-hydroxybutyryl-CoA dehydrogenase